MALVYLDGFFLKVLGEGLGVERAAVYVALGVTPCGGRQVLGFWLLPTENAHAWEEVLKELWKRGLRRVLLFVTDGLPGMEEAICRVYPLAQWQRCVVHQVRASLAQVRSQHRALLAQDLRGVHGKEPAGGPWGSGEAEGGLGCQVPLPGGRTREPCCAFTITPRCSGPICGAPT